MTGNPIVHVEFATNDPKATGQFLQELFGWRIETDSNLDYTMFMPESGPGGGLPRASDTMRPGETLVYVGTDDLEATLARALELGGKVIMPKTEIPAMGWFAIISDAAGAHMALYQGMQSDGGSA